MKITLGYCCGDSCIVARRIEKKPINGLSMLGLDHLFSFGTTELPELWIRAHSNGAYQSWFALPVKANALGAWDLVCKKVLKHEVRFELRKLIAPIHIGQEAPR